MGEGFFLFHTTEHDRLERFRESADWAMATCLRSLVVFSSHRLPAELVGAVIGELGSEFSGIDLYQDEEAFGFLLEVACGLHSPIIGETEVMGQFKASIQAVSPDRREDSRIFHFLQSILTEAKKIRTEHLSGFGSQSYGSLCRRELQGMHSVHLLGAGKLTKDLLPWFLEFPEVEVYCRSVKKGASLKDAYPKVEILPWGCDQKKGDQPLDARSALVIAAPVSDSELRAWMDVHGHSFEKLIDLRAEHTKTEDSPLNDSQLRSVTVIIGLNELFQSVKSTQDEMSERVAVVKNEIRVLVQKKANAIQIRPLGWDEICA
jgi:glutamyl-tRNA reductase